MVYDSRVGMIPQVYEVVTVAETDGGCLVQSFAEYEEAIRSAHPKRLYLRRSLFMQKQERIHRGLVEAFRPS